MAIRGWLKRVPTGRAVYDSVQPRAEGVKAILQIAIGIISIAFLLIDLAARMPESGQQAADRSLTIVGVALAFSAAVELAYTFFTDGPDEALDPLILGVSSFGLIEISKSSAHLKDLAVPILLVGVAILALFVARRFFLEVRKEGSGSRDPSERPKLPPDAYHG